MADAEHATRTDRLRPPDPLEIQERPPTDLSETLRKLQEFYSSHCGIATEITPARYGGVFRDLEGYAVLLERVTQHAARRHDDLRRGNPDDWMQELSGHYGFAVSLDRDRALAAALGESLERYAAMFYDPSGAVEARWPEVADVAVHPGDFPMYTEAEARRVPGCELYRDDAPFRWVWATDLARGEPCLVPMQLVWIVYNALPDEPLLKYGNSAGWGAHNTREEAMVRGILERLEHAAHTIVWANELVLPRVDLDTVEHPRTRRFLDMLEPLDADLHVIEATTDVPVPTFLGIIRGRDPRFPPVVMGLGADLDPEEGVLQAVEEAFSQYSYLGHRHRIDRTPPEKHEVEGVLDHLYYYYDESRIDEAAWLWSSEETVAVSEIPSPQGPAGNPGEKIKTLVRVLDEAGVRVLAVDTTPPDLDAADIRTTEILTPELPRTEYGHHAIGKDCERLYQAPVRMGVRDEARTPSTLNDGVSPHA